MNLNKYSLICISLIFVIPFLLAFSQIHSTQESEESNLTNKELRNLFSKMKYIEGDTFIMGRNSSLEIRMTASDSTLFLGGINKRTVVDPYFISVTEITNGDWREFYQAMVLELGESIGKRKYFPDTSTWVKEFPYSYNAPMAENYFSHPNFNDCPVVGITWDQANAYCTWKSNKLKKLLEKVGIKSSPKFRLPSEAEWENAAKRKEKVAKNKNPSAYGWVENNQIGKINHLANIGQIRDINNVILKQYAEDRCLYTCKVASYPPNENKIYDMAGNVAEWTSDQGYVLSTGLKNQEFKTLTSVSEIDSEIELIKNDFDVLDPFIKKLSLEYLAHNRKVLSSNDIKICKGGSWAHGMIYTQIGSRQGISKNNTSSTIGFRLVISNVNPNVKKYFPKKSWKPGK